MDLSDCKSIKIAGIEMKKILIDGVVAWERAVINWVKKSTNTDGSIYNGTGYKDNVRLSSSGAEKELKRAACTGYIPVKGGDVVRIYPIDSTQLSGSGTGFNVYDASFTHLGQAASNGTYGIFAGAYSAYSWQNSCVSEGGGVYRWTVPPVASGVAYIRITMYDGTTTDGVDFNGSQMIVTVNEPIE